MLSYAEKEIQPVPEGRARSMLLFFYVIDLLQRHGIEFYVKGGILLQYQLGEHARPTYDIDLLVPGDADEFYEKANAVLSSQEGPLTFEIKLYRKTLASASYYHNTFSMDLFVYLKRKRIDVYTFEGIYGDAYLFVNPVTYKGPDIIREGFTYLGVPIECILAEKILAITSELPRPYKHLVDVYSLISTNINVATVKQYLDYILGKAETMRNSLGLSKSDYVYQITDSKQFTDSYFFETLQAGYTLGELEMRAKVNAWLKANI